MVYDADGVPSARHADTLGCQRVVNTVRWSPGGDVLASAVRRRDVRRVVADAAAASSSLGATLTSRPNATCQGDAGELILWRPAPAASAAAAAAAAASGATLLDGSAVGCGWRQGATLKHADDLMDVCWSPDGSHVATASVDNGGRVWKVGAWGQGGKKGLAGGGGGAGGAPLEGHTHFVQGCAWDPRGEFVATAGADRSVRLFGSTQPGRWAQKGVLSKAPQGGSGGAAPHLFHDEALPSFFRRLAWAPDGSALLAPGGCFPVTPTQQQHAAAAAAPHAAPAAPAAAAAAAGGGASAASAPQPPPPAPHPVLHNTTWLFKRGCWARPAASLPGASTHGGKSVAVRFSPVLWAHRDAHNASAAAAECVTVDAAACGAAMEPPAPPSPIAAAAEAASAPAPPPPTPPPGPDGAPVFRLPYRLLFAVATLDHVVVYDSCSDAPLCVVGGLHCAPITDVAWHPSGLLLAVSSTDGFVSFVSFSEGELGIRCGEGGTPPPPPHVAASLHAAAVAAARARAEAAAAGPQPAGGGGGGGGGAGDAPAASPPPRPPHAPTTQRRIAPQPMSAPAAAGGEAAPLAQPRRITPLPIAQPPPAVAEASQPAECGYKRAREGEPGEAEG